MPIRLPDRCFHTVDDAGAEHAVDRDVFMRTLREAAGSEE
jgi:hypothetical protein